MRDEADLCSATANGGFGLESKELYRTITNFELLISVYYKFVLLYFRERETELCCPKLYVLSPTADIPMYYESVIDKAICRFY